MRIPPATSRLAGSLAIVLAGCARDPELPRPVLDPSLAARNVTTLEFDLARSKPDLVAPRHEFEHAGTRFAVVTRTEPVPVDPSGVAGPVLTSIGWRGSDPKGAVTWFETGLAGVGSGPTEIDGAELDGRYVVVAATPPGLLEIELEVRDSAPVVASRRVIAAPGMSPLLIAGDKGLLLFVAGHGGEVPARTRGGIPLWVSRRQRGSGSWSVPEPLTFDLSDWTRHYRAVCVRGSRVTVAWADNRHAVRSRNLEHVDFTRKLCVATSLDHGVTWSSPVLLPDPHDDSSAGLGLGVFDDGTRIVVMRTARCSGSPRPGSRRTPSCSPTT